MKFIQTANPDWDPDDGICSGCLDNLQRDYLSQSSRVIQSDEPTVSIASDELLTDVPEEDKGACFITIHGPNLGKKYDLSDKATTIGRAENCDIFVPEENVSRQHARISKNAYDFVIEDLNSTNGTFVNTRRVTNHMLKDGDLILIGNVILKFISGSHIENKYHEEIYRLATLDGLTQLYNKAYFLDRLAEEFSRSRRYGRNLSVILFDFDLFHVLNNTYGHLAGDYVLRKVARMILRNIRKEDVVGRYGGEEFVILLPEISLENTLMLAEKLRKLVEETKFEYSGVAMEVTISVGVATLTRDLRNRRELLEKADQALYQAKADGRNLVRFAQ